METKKSNMHGYNRKKLKWAIRNNFVFFVIAGIICIIIGLIFGKGVFNYERVKSVESLLGKTVHTIHRRTGLTDADVEKLRNEHPDFDWEGTWDRQRWQSGVERQKEERSQMKAREK